MVALGSEMALQQGFLGSKMKYTSKFAPELLGSGAWNLVCSIAWWFFTKFVQTKVPGSKMAPRQGVLGSNHRNIFKNLLQNHLAQMFEIWYIALPGGPLTKFVQMKVPGSKMASCQGS